MTRSTIRTARVLPAAGRLFRVLLLASLAGAVGACRSQPPPPPIRTAMMLDFMPMLGADPNEISYRWSFYAGNAVSSFRVQFASQTLPPDAKVSLLDGTGDVIQEIRGTLGGWSATIPGNILLVHVFARPQGPPPVVQISDMEYQLRNGPIFPEEQTAAQDYASSRLLGRNQAAWGYLRGTDTNDFFVTGNLAGKPIDIVVVSLDGAPLDVYASYDEFLIGPDRAAFTATAAANAPAFLEFDSFPRSKVFLTVRSTSGSGRYYVMVNELDLKFWISYEFDNDDLWNRALPSSTETYFERVQKLAAAASAVLYDATDGRMRFDVVTIYKTERDFTVGDVFIHDETGYRANADSWDIDIARNHLEDMQSWTVTHEWGHYEFGLPDEYEDTGPDMTRAFCPNSLMAVNGVPDFCVDMNHDPTGAFGGDSMWEEIFDLYDDGRAGFSRQVSTPGGERFPGLDLLPSITWRIFE